MRSQLNLKVRRTEVPTTIENQFHKNNSFEFARRSTQLPGSISQKQMQHMMKHGMESYIDACMEELHPSLSSKFEFAPQVSGTKKPRMVSLHAEDLAVRPRAQTRVDRYLNRNVVGTSL